MDLNELKIQLEEVIMGIPEGQISLRQAEKYAIDFCRLQAHLASIEKSLRANKADLNLELKVNKAYAQQNAHGANVPEKKMNAEADTKVLETNKSIDNTDADLKYIDRMFGVCENYHTYFRKICG